MPSNGRDGRRLPAALDRTNRCVFLNPQELRAAVESNFAAFSGLSHHEVYNDTDASQFIQAGYIEVASLHQHNPGGTDALSVPPLNPSAEDEAAAEAAALWNQPAPVGEVNYLPSTMPDFHEGPGSTADKIVELFQDKVVDTWRNKVWHHLRMWDDKTRKTYQYMYKDSDNFGNRVLAYYAIKCGAASVSELPTITLNNMIKKGRAERKKQYNDKGRAVPKYFDLGLRLFK